MRMQKLAEMNVLEAINAINSDIYSRGIYRVPCQDGKVFNLKSMVAELKQWLPYRDSGLVVIDWNRWESLTNSIRSALSTETLKDYAGLKKSLEKLTK